MPLDPFPLQAAQNLPYIVQDWFRKLRNFVTDASGLIPWTSISKTGSNLTDLVTRNHNSLQNISGGAAGDYYHLKQTEWDHAHTLGILTSKSVAGNTNVTLSTAEAQCRILELTGVITGNINVVVPTAVWQWTYFNNTTGAFTVTLKTTAGTGIVVATGMRAILYCDGTNVVRATADV